MEIKFQLQGNEEANLRCLASIFRCRYAKNIFNSGKSQDAGKKREKRTPAGDGRVLLLPEYAKTSSDSEVGLQSLLILKICVHKISQAVYASTV